MGMITAIQLQWGRVWSRGMFMMQLLVATLPLIEAVVQVTRSL
jgi:hypothetical protein